VNTGVSMNGQVNQNTSTITMTGTGSSITNNLGSAIFSQGSGSAVTMSGTNETLTNWNNIQSYLGSAVTITNTGSGQIFNNAATLIYGRAGNPGIFNSGSLTSLSNAGSIGSANSLGIANNGSITNLINTGTIAGGGGISAIDNSAGTITRLTNNGDLTGSAPNGVGLYNSNSGIVTTLDNGQGGNSSTAATTALTLRGKLPTNYNIIVTSPTQYGQLSVLNTTGTMTFGIYGGGVTGVAASTLAAGTYSSVLSGVSLSNLIGATSGTYGSYNWSLQSNSSNFDLIVTANGSSGGGSSSGSTSSAPAYIIINPGQVVSLASIPPHTAILLNGGVLTNGTSNGAAAWVDQPVYLASSASLLSGSFIFAKPVTGPGSLVIGYGKDGATSQVVFMDRTHGPAD